MNMKYEFKIVVRMLHYVSKTILNVNFWYRIVTIKMISCENNTYFDAKVIWSENVTISTVSGKNCMIIFGAKSLQYKVIWCENGK